MGSVDDLAAAVGVYGGQPVSPHLESLGCQSCPVRDLADDPERRPGAVRPRGIARELLVGDVGIVLELPGRFHLVDARGAVAGGKFGGEARAVAQCGEVDVVHHDFRPVIGPESRGELVAHLQIGFRAMEERPLVQYLAHPPRLQMSPAGSPNDNVTAAARCRPPLEAVVVTDLTLPPKLLCENLVTEP